MSRLLRRPVEWKGEHTAVFRDDDAAGWQLRLTRGNDGDFWLSIVPDHRDMTDEEQRARTAAAYSQGGIRVRAPIHGGGSHELLYHALAFFWKQLENERRTAPDPVRP